MISSEYGWPDQRILDMYLCRLIQVVKAIEVRRKNIDLRRDLIVEWQTKTIASFIAGTVKTEKGKTNQLAKAVDKIRLVSEEDLPKVSNKRPEVNAAGTFEQLQHGFRPKDK